MSLEKRRMLACAGLLIASACTESRPASPGLEAADHALASQCGTLLPGETLFAGESVTSCDGTGVLTHQLDGNVVLYAIKPGGGRYARWQTNTAGLSTMAFTMQGDGNLVLYTNQGLAAWSSGTSAPGSRLSLTQCNLEVIPPTSTNVDASVAPGGGPTWTSSTTCGAFWRRLFSICVPPGSANGTPPVAGQECGPAASFRYANAGPCGTGGRGRLAELWMCE